MHPAIIDWAVRYGIPAQMLDELQVALLRSCLPEESPLSGKSETAVQQRVRFNAASAGWLVWRNNVGVLEDKDGRHVRFGLCNDSKKLNERIKSHDLVGLRPLLVTQAHVGTTIGQFVSRECKHGDWRYAGTDREIAQAAFATLVNGLGGDAKFTTGGL